MEKGSLRCDANVSIRPVGVTTLGTKTELKNMNSFKAVKNAIDHEVGRHQKILETGGKIIQETLLWDDAKQITITMRSKEEAHDYRYFPEPDLVPFTVDQKFIKDIRQTLSELPDVKSERFMAQYKLNDYDTKILVQDRDFAQFFEDCNKSYSDPKKIANWMNGPVSQEVNEKKVGIHELKIKPQDLTSLIKLVDDGVVSNLVAKDIFKTMIESGKSAQTIVQEQGLAQVSDDSALEKIIEDIIKENDKVVAQIKEGKDSAMAFLVGQAMKKTQGKANPKKINELIKRRFSNG